MRKLAVVGVALLACTTHGLAHAATPVFTAPVAIGGGAWDPQTYQGFGLPQALLAADGRTTVAWPGMGHLVTQAPTGGEGVFVSELPAGGGTFSPPVKVSDDNTSGVLLASNDGGVRVLGWSASAAPEQALTVMIAPPGLGFGSAQHVPVAPRAPATDPRVSEDSRFVALTSLAVAPDGTLVVAYIDSDRRAEDMRGVVVLRHPDGSWTQPEVVDDQVVRGGPTAVADGVGGLHVVWSHTPPNDPRPITTLHEAELGPDGHVGAGQQLSAAGRRVDLLTDVTADRRGDVLVVWQGQSVDSPLPPAGSVDVEASLRPAGGGWDSPRVMSDASSPGGGRLPTGALDDRGDALVSWGDESFALAVFRRVGAGWGPVIGVLIHQGRADEMPTALDADGNGLLTAAVTRSAGTRDTIAAFVIRAGGDQQPVTVSTGTDPVSQPEIATDRFGNGVLVWLRGAAGEPSRVLAAGYSAAPPDVSGVSAKRGAFALKVSEPARVTVTVSGRHRRAVQWSRVRRGKSTLAFNAKVRSLLARHGRYKATFRARDAGPRASRPRTITFTR